MNSTLLLAASITLAGLFLAPASPAQAAPEYFQLHNAYNGKCIDADKGMIAHNGTRLQLWDCHTGDNQAWYWDGDQLVNKASGRCLDADTQTAAYPGTRVRLWDCSGAVQQKWWSESTPEGYSMIISLATHRPLDADRNVLFQNGTEVQIWGDWNSVEHLNQQWYATS
ncbi:RICIN domain-containing protein [Catenuloplanes sp. NPDC051500]|uniref:RICIN domain-containing protein n=1 Tax=Catenuloplanes sp. NPDC051500 TaxID=3363959 RepID=UPI0037ACB918